MDADAADGPCDPERTWNGGWFNGVTYAACNVRRASTGSQIRRQMLNWTEGVLWVSALIKGQ